VPSGGVRCSCARPQIKTEADLKRCADDMAIIAKRFHPAPGAIKPHYP
jgi:hypothetical protein